MSTDELGSLFPPATAGHLAGACLGSPPDPSSRPPSTLVAGWKMPTGECCGVMLPTAVYTGEDWHLALECQGGPDCEEEPIDVAWPFVEKIAGPDDFRRAGFDVI